jgi:hypothetical protein
MKYALLIYSNGAREDYARMPQAEREAITAEYMAISELPGSVGGAELESPDTATTIRVQDGETLTTDGPFAETKETLGGFYLFEADNIDEALEVAARIPAARLGGAVEVRPLVEH